MMQGSILKLTGLVTCGWLFLVFAAAPASADLYTASQAYKKGEFEKSFQEFKELAELGQPEAQFNLAVLYARGEGTTASNIHAHAWASLAAQNGFSRGSALAAQLEANLPPTSLAISYEYQTLYSPAKLNERLLPHMLTNRDYADRDPVRPSKPFIPAYPAGAQSRGVQGEVFVEFVVAADGHTRMPRILYAVPGGYFESTVRESVLRSVYLPARINGLPISTSVNTFYNFKMKDITIKDYGNLEERVNATKLKAEAGDASAQMLYGMMIAGLPQLKQTYAQAMPWFLKAAQAGSPYAQYQVGTGLLLGHGCQCDGRKGEIWLEKAAQADQPDAQVTLAEYLLNESADPDSASGAVTWLERAVKQNNDAAKLLLASLMAASASDKLRDPARALALTDKLEHDYKEDPSFWEIRAAANAGAGNYDVAIKQESKALDEASQLGWNVDPLRQRQDSYTSHSAWHGNLLKF